MIQRRFFGVLVLSYPFYSFYVYVLFYHGDSVSVLGRSWSYGLGEEDTIVSKIVLLSSLRATNFV